jgi:ribosomal protein S18 acetylase RimI-like enzyme
MLGKDTWKAYADLIERHGGIWGGYWCMGFHTDKPDVYASLEEKIADRRSRVCNGRSRAALVFYGEKAIGLCQFGPSCELTPKNKFKRLYQSGLTVEPDWRITCIFVDRKYRGKGVSNMALEAALKVIAAEGGGLVEAYPESMEGRKVAGSIIYLGTLTMFERHRFTKLRQVAKHHWVMAKVV